MRSNARSAKPEPAPVGVDPDGDAVAARSLESLIEELSGEIREYTALSDRYFAFAGTLLIGVLGVLASVNGERLATGVSIAAPFALLAMLHYVAQLQTERAARIGMKRAAEEKLLSLVPAGRFSTVAVLGRSVGQRRPSVLLSIGVYAIAAAVTIVVCAHNVDRTVLSESPVSSISVLAALVVLTVTATASAVELLRAEGQAYRASSTAGVRHGAR
jgi:hypothetical protein